MNNVLIIGATGLLGKSLVNHFFLKGYHVGGLCRLNFGYNENNIAAYSVDILDYSALEKVISKYDVIINCTGQITKPINNCIVLNTKGIDNIIKAVKYHSKHLIHISSVSVYGSSEFVNEDSNLNPETVYGASKYFSEYMIQRELESFVILRTCNLYGKDQKKGILNYILESYRKNEPNLHFNNNGLLKRYYLHLDDLCNTIIRLLDRKLLGCYNVTSNDFYTIKELIELVEGILNYKFIVHYSDANPLENINHVDDCKLESLFAYKNQSMKNYLKKLYVNN